MRTLPASPTENQPPDFDVSNLETVFVWWCTTHHQPATGWPHSPHQQTPTACRHWWRNQNCTLLKSTLVLQHPRTFSQEADVN